MLADPTPALYTRAWRYDVTPTLDATHDATTCSWVASANDPHTDFPLQNLPLGVFRRAGTREEFRGGVAIGDQILDLDAVVAAGLATDSASEAALRCAAGPTLNPLMAQGPGAWQVLRLALFAMLREGSAAQHAAMQCLVPQSAAEHALPATIGDYTDFYSSRHHALQVGRIYRPANPLTPNYDWMPIAYHGRASSVVVSGQPIRRPQGQRLPPGSDGPVFGPSQELDYELEVGVFVGPGNSQGTAIPLDRAEQHVFGLCLLNDWSARDIQRWEAQPLGPFLGKNFATTISPWVVTLAALAPFRAPLQRDPAVASDLAYLDSSANRTSGAFDVELAVLLETAAMRSRRQPPQRVARSNLRHAHWTIAQMIAHHTVGGCNLRSGDLLGSGTQSGPRLEEAGSLLELTGNGTRPLRLANGEERGYLADGDRIVLRARCQRSGYVAVGFGEASGLILSA